MKKRITALLSFILAIGFLVCCSKETQTQQDLVSYLDNLGKQYEEICVEMGTANWNLYSKLVLHRELRRALNVAYKNPAERGQKYAEYMNKMQEALEPRVLALMKKRNAKSREAGFSDYGELCLYMMGLLPDGTRWFYDVLESIDRKTTEPYQTLLTKAKKKAGVDDIGWDNLNKLVFALREPLPRTQVAPAAKPMDLTKETLMNIGFNLAGADIPQLRVVPRSLQPGFR
jgi:hypothetical protein